MFDKHPGANTDKIYKQFNIGTKIEQLLSTEDQRTKQTLQSH